jgi:4-amino-4-deoxy-L-arabinose transferase-like glycosyltransferase
MRNASQRSGKCSRRSSSTRGIVFAIALLTLHIGLLAYSGWAHSSVFNELGHLASGLSHLEFLNFDGFRVNPPLVRTVVSVPVSLASPETDWGHYYDDPLARAEYALGGDLAVANGRRVFDLLTIARWSAIPFSLLGAIVCQRWARQLYGASAGKLALLMWCLSPYVLGHGSLIVADAHAAALGLVAWYGFWLWLKKPSWRMTLVAGIALGLALLAKFTLLILVALVPIAIGLGWNTAQRETFARVAGHRLLKLSAMFLIVLWIVNLGYAFEGSFMPIREYRFQSELFAGDAPEGGFGRHVGNRFRGWWIEGLPVPVPRNFLQGIDTQRFDFEHGKRSYLRGEWKDHGWSYFYLYALAVKLPLGFWCLMVLAIGASLCQRGYSATWRDELVLLLPLLAILVLVSSQTGFSVHSRYVLPALPFALVWISKMGRAIDLGHRRLSFLIVGAACWYSMSSLWIYPHSLSYFNEVVRGPHGGHAHLLDSNIAWGQDLFYVERWNDAHPEARPFFLAAWGHTDPRLVGVEFRVPRMVKEDDEDSDDSNADLVGPLPGWHAIDVNHLRGSRTLIPDSQGHWLDNTTGAHDFSWYLRFEPVAYAGYSINIYHITLDEANRVRRELGLAELGEDWR